MANENTISNLDDLDNDAFLEAVHNMGNKTREVVDPARGVIDTVNADGSVEKTVDIDDESDNSDKTKLTDDNIEVDKTDTDDDNLEVSEHSQEDEKEIEDESTDIDVPSEDSEDDIQTIDEIDYKEFYNKVTNGFEMNGLNVKSLSDPDKIIELQRLNLTRSSSRDELEDVKPIVQSLRDGGLLDDPEKFGLMMEVLNGDENAIKKLLKDKNIDPYTLDMDEIDDSVDSNKYRISSEEMNFNDFVTEATKMGVRDDMADRIINSWDDDSLLGLVNDPNGRTNIIKHIKTGMFDKVQAEILSITNEDSSFSRESDLDQYIVASNNVADRLNASRQKDIVLPDEKKVVKKATKKVAKPKVTKDDQKEVNNERIKKAEEASVASASPTSSAPSDTKGVELMDLSSEDFMKEMARLGGF